jgi:hypothetical protein
MYDIEKRRLSNRRYEKTEKARLRIKRYRQCKKGKLAFKRQNEKRKQKYPDKIKAKDYVNYAVRKGLLFRQPCIICGDKSVFHHPDYNKILDVIPLCVFHHNQLHRIKPEKGMNAINEILKRMNKEKNKYIIR